MEKHCKICNILQPLENYEPARRYADGKDTRCRACRAKEHKESRIRRKKAVELGLLYPGAICPICETKTVMTQKESYTRQAIVDHDHHTNEIRGVICSLCNSGLGKLGDTFKSISNAYKYMEKHYRKD